MKQLGARCLHSFGPLQLLSLHTTGGIPLLRLSFVVGCAAAGKEERSCRPLLSWLKSCSEVDDDAPLAPMADKAQALVSNGACEGAPRWAGGRCSSGGLQGGSLVGTEKYLQPRGFQPTC